MGPVRVATIALCAAFAATGCAPTPTDSAPAEDTASTTATVEWISDGDTLRLTNGRKVRLLQVDAPEHQTDCWGPEATRALIGLAPKGTRVTLQADSSLDDKDTYGRLLRYVLVDGKNVNLALVEKGAAAPYFFRNERGRYSEQLLGAAKAARASRLGFWKACPDAELNPGLGSITGPAAHQRG